MSRLLVVDDDIQMLSALEAALRHKGNTVETASNGIEAASKLENATFQVVITDLRMPGMDGLELLHHVRRTKPALPVIVLSAYEFPAPQLFSSLVEAFLRKPLELDALLGTIQRVATEGAAASTKTWLS